MPKIIPNYTTIPGQGFTILDLDLGEIALNVSDGNLYLKKETAGVPSVVILAGPGNVAVSSSYALTSSYANYAAVALNATNSLNTLFGIFSLHSYYSQLARTASFAYKADYSDFALKALTATNASTASLPIRGIITASAAGSTITFTKGDSSTFNVSVTTATAQTASYVTSSNVDGPYGKNSILTASYALTASLPLRGLITASAVGSTITFTKGDSSTFNVTITTATAETASYVSSSNVDGPYGKNSILSASYAVTASYVLNAISASYALSASQAFSSSYAFSASQAVSSSYALSASFTSTASYSLSSLSASYASTASNIEGGATNYITLWRTNTALTSSVMYQSSSNITIGGGAILPSARLEVKGAGSTSATAALNVINASSTDLLYLRNDGFVGIGTASAASTENMFIKKQWTIFDQGVDLTNYTIVDISNTTSVLRLGVETNSGGGIATNSTAYAGIIGTTKNIPLQFITSGSVKTTITSTGNFGIGITSPLYTLDVSGSARITSSVFLPGLINTSQSHLISYNSSSGQLYYLGTGSFTASWANNTISASNAQTASYILNAVSASFASTASYVLNAVSASFASTASLSQNALTASFITASNVWGPFGSNSIISSSFASTASYVLNAVSASFAATASSADNFLVRGTLTAQTIIAQVITSSTDFVTGSTRFGTQLTNTHQFTGSVSITGSLTVTGAGITGSLFGTASWAVSASQALTASYVLNAVSSSYALSASQAQNATTASYVLNAVSASFASTASFVQNAISASFASTASYVLNAVSASFASTASFVQNAVSASFASTASLAQNALTASFVTASNVWGPFGSNSIISSSFASTASLAQNAVSTSFAATASSADNFTVRGTLTAQTIVTQVITSSTDFVTGSSRFGTLLTNTHQFTGSVSITGSLNVVGAGITGSLFGTSSWANNAISSSYALSASQAQNAVSASYVLNAVSASFASTASYVLNAVSASFASTASFVQNAVSASFASTASLAINALTASFVTASNIFGPFGSNSVISSSFASTASFVQNAISASFAATASSADNFTVRGTLTAQTIVTQVITSSTDFVTGSSRFGTLLSNTHQFTGSVSITGSLNVTGAGITGSLFGTSSWAVSASQAVTASYVLNAVSASFASTASFVQNAVSASFASTASFVQNAVSASFASTASYITASGVFGPFGSNSVISASHAVTAAFAANSSGVSGGAANYITMWTSATALSSSTIYQSTGNIGIGTITPNAKLDVNGNAIITGSLTVAPNSNIEFQVQTAGVKIGNVITDAHTITGSVNVSGSVTATNFTGSLFGTSSWAVNALQASTASYILNAISASFASTASFVQNAVSASFASTASFVQNAVSASFAAIASSADNFAVRNTLTATTIVVQTITSSIDFVTGSSRFGTLLSNTHQFTGSVSMTGSLTVTGAGITGSLFGTSSWAVSASQALTASYVLNAISASFVATASYITASGVFGPFGSNSVISASHAVTAAFAANSSGISGGAANYITMWTGATTLSSSVIYQSAGNIGINTISPNAKLDINGSTIITGSLIVSSSAVRLTVSGSQALFNLTGTTPSIVISGSGYTFAARIGSTSNNQYSWLTNIYYDGANFQKDDTSRSGWRMNQVAETTDTTSSMEFNYFPIGTTISVQPLVIKRNSLLINNQITPVNTGSVSFVNYAFANQTGSGFYGSGSNLDSVKLAFNRSDEFEFSSSGMFRAADDIVGFYSFSDRNLKYDVRQVCGSVALDQVQQLQGVYYKWVGDQGSRANREEIGLIAQDVEKIIPQLVREQERLGQGTFKTVDYDHLTALLIEAIKEQQKQIDELKSRLDAFTK